MFAAMRTLWIIPLLMLSSGCTTLIAGSGTDLSRLKTIEQVHSKFGTPATKGTTDDQQFEVFCINKVSRPRECQTFENYRSRRKIASPGACYYMHLTIPTLGLSELVTVPIELLQLTRTTLRGQDICFTYDSSGQVSGVFIDGRPFPTSLY
jgi:hypothetical protein